MAEEKGARRVVPLYEAKAEFFKTLGHPVRIRLLELLCERDRPVYELLHKISIEPSNMSQHLAVLRRTRLVTVRRQAGEVIYSASAPEVRDLLLVARRILTDLLDLDVDVDIDLAPSHQHPDTPRSSSPVASRGAESPTP